MAEPEKPTPVPVLARPVYSNVDAQRARTRRRADLEDLAEVDDVLAGIDVRAKELPQRTATVLALNIPATEKETLNAARRALIPTTATGSVHAPRRHGDRHGSSDQHRRPRREVAERVAQRHLHEPTPISASQV